MSRRLVAALAAAAVVAAPSVSTAAPKPAPQIVDAKGDAAGAQASLDISTVLFTTSGVTTVTRVGKKRKTTYTPTKLVVVETLGAAPNTTPGIRYRIEAEIAGCGQFDIYYVNGESGTTGYVWVDCPESDAVGEGGTLIELSPKVGATTLTWEIPLKALTKDVKVGAVVSGFRAFTDIGDPVTGILGTGDGLSNALVIGDDPSSGVVVADVATGNGAWKIG